MFSFSKGPHLPSNLILLSVLGEQLGIPVSPDRKLRHRLARCHTGSVMTSEGHRHSQPPSQTSHSQIWWTSSRGDKGMGSLDSANGDQDPTLQGPGSSATPIQDSQARCQLLPTLQISDDTAQRICKETETLSVRRSVND